MISFALTVDCGAMKRGGTIMSTSNARGVIRGKVIELDEDLGIAAGQKVEVTVRVVPEPGRRPGEGFLRTEGALADDPYWDDIMDEIYRARKQERRPQAPDLGDA